LLKTSLDNSLLVEELQLGEKLNQCIHSNRRSDFALMLSMLTEDVRAHSQFAVPKTEVSETKSTEAGLRKALELPDKAALAVNSSEDLNEFSQADLIHEGQLASLHFDNYAKPKPLAFRDDSKHIATEIMSNTSLYCQKQHKIQHGGVQKQSNSRLAFNANEWLKAVQNTVVKAPLLAMHA